MSDSHSLEKAIALGESQALEFKTSLSEQKEGLQSLCGMLNADIGKGTVLFGVKPDGSICGAEPGNLDSAQRSLSQLIQQKFDPPIIPTIQVVSIREKTIIVVQATRARSMPYHEYGGRAYIRAGSETRILSLAEKETLRKKRDRDGHNGPWRCDRCGSMAGMIISLPQKSYTCDCGGEYWPA